MLEGDFIFNHQFLGDVLVFTEVNVKGDILRMILPWYIMETHHLGEDFWNFPSIEQVHFESCGLGA